MFEMQLCDVLCYCNGYCDTVWILQKYYIDTAKILHSYYMDIAKPTCVYVYCMDSIEIHVWQLYTARILLKYCTNTAQILSHLHESWFEEGGVEHAAFLPGMPHHSDQILLPEFRVGRVDVADIAEHFLRLDLIQQ
jgi:hypothetical protein